MKGNSFNMNKLMKQAQQMQKDLQKTQSELENVVETATSGGGMVEVKMNGKYELLSLKIKPEVVDPSDVETLEDLIISAINQVKDKINQMTETEMSKITGDLKMPGIF